MLLVSRGVSSEGWGITGFHEGEVLVVPSEKCLLNCLILCSWKNRGCCTETNSRNLRKAFPLRTFEKANIYSLKPGEVPLSLRDDFIETLWK